MAEDLSINTMNGSLGLLSAPSISSGTELFGMFEHSLIFLLSEVRPRTIEDLEEMNLSKLHELIDESIRLLKENGCESICIVRKSFSD